MRQVQWHAAEADDNCWLPASKLQNGHLCDVPSRLDGEAVTIRDVWHHLQNMIGEKIRVQIHHDSVWVGSNQVQKHSA